MERQLKIIPEERELKDKEYFKHRDYSPELWAAKFGHLILCGDYRLHIYKDKEFEKWVHELFRILHSEDIQEIRQKLLTKEEIQEIERQSAEF